MADPLKDFAAGVLVAVKDADEMWGLMDVYIENYRMPIEEHIDRHVSTLLFPHVRIASQRVLVLPDAESYRDAALQVDDFGSPAGITPRGSLERSFKPTRRRFT